MSQDIFDNDLSYCSFFLKNMQNDKIEFWFKLGKYDDLEQAYQHRKVFLV
uniref:Uncharacterized protein n=1 Tax=Arundo donax TaxID=35708 RepID=A0A0A9GPL7_ARUDO